MFGALAAGVTLGAKVPVVLFGRGESMEVRMAACVLASLVAQAPQAAGVASEARPESAPRPTVRVARLTRVPAQPRPAGRRACGALTPGSTRADVSGIRDARAASAAGRSR